MESSECVSLLCSIFGEKDGYSSAGFRHPEPPLEYFLVRNPFRRV